VAMWRNGTKWEEIFYSEQNFVMERFLVGTNHFKSQYRSYGAIESN